MAKLLSLIFVRLPTALGDTLAKLRALTEPLGLITLILLGLHGAADLLDDILFAAVDGTDRAADALASSLLAWLGEAEILAAQTAAAWSDSFALLLDIDRKEALAVVLALLVELCIDLALLWWCLPSRGDASAASSAETADAQGAKRKLQAATATVKRRGPGFLRGTALVLAFGLGAFGLGRYAAGYVALWVSGPMFGPSAGFLAQLGGLLLAGIAILTLLPLALRRAAQRSQVLMWTGLVRSLVFPLLVATLLAGAIVTGGPGQSLLGLMGVGP